MRKLKGIILVVLLVASVLMPFNIYADTLITTSNITGCHITDMSFTDSTAYNNITCDMDDNYYGYASMTIQYYVGSSSSPNSQAYFVTVSGNTFDVVIPTSNTSINRQKAISVIQVNDNHIYLIDDMNKDDIMWMFPIESFGICSYNINNNYSKYNGIRRLNNYMFPIFNLSANDIIYGSYFYKNYQGWLIFFTDKNIYDVNTASQYISIDNAEITEFVNIETLIYNGNLGHIMKIKYKANAQGASYFKLKQAMTFMPIYCNYITNTYISTDFALNFGLSNSYLDNIQTIADGTSGSQSSVNDVDSQNQQFESDRDDLIDIEDNFNEDMNDKLDVIDTNTGVSGFGGYFMNSAVWVRTQFDRLTNNTPYGSLIVYGMTLGLALLLLGKVFL